MTAAKPDLAQSAHRALAEFSDQDLRAISQATIGIVGLGGIGCPAALYLAAAGIGKLILCDFDRVAASNLNRQVLYGANDIDQRKTEAAKKALTRLYPDIRVDILNQRATQNELDMLIPKCNLVVDASDNFATRLAVNQTSVAHGKPWVMAAAIRFEAQVALLDPGDSTSPCYHCIYGDAAEQLEDCAGAGVFGPITGIAGTMAASLALLKLAGRTHRGLILLDSTTMQWQKLNINRQSDCPVCGT